jgi:hypothetical protein
MRVYQFRHVGMQNFKRTTNYGSFWCPRRDSNPHTSRHMDLNHARLPIPPRGQSNNLNARQLVPTEGLEPPHLAAHGPEPCASTNSATWALDRFACIARRCRRIPLRYQALPFCARPTFVRFQRASPAQRLRFRLGRFRRDREYSGWMANVKDPPNRTFPARFIRVLGEFAGPPLHYACLRVNVTRSAPSDGRRHH